MQMAARLFRLGRIALSSSSPRPALHASQWLYGPAANCDYLGTVFWAGASWMVPFCSATSCALFLLLLLLLTVAAQRPRLWLCWDEADCLARGQLKEGTAFGDLLSKLPCPPLLLLPVCATDYFSDSLNHPPCSAQVCLLMLMWMDG